MANLLKRVDGAFGAVNLKGMSVPAKVAVVVVVVGAAVLTTIILVLDWVSEHPSSTAPLIFPFMALYVSIAVAFVALLNWGIRRLLGR